MRSPLLLALLVTILAATVSCWQESDDHHDVITVRSEKPMKLGECQASRECPGNSLCKNGRCARARKFAEHDDKVISVRSEKPMKLGECKSSRECPGNSLCKNGSCARARKFAEHDDFDNDDNNDVPSYKKLTYVCVGKGICF